MNSFSKHKSTFFIFLLLLQSGLSAAPNTPPQYHTYTSKPAKPTAAFDIVCKGAKIHVERFGTGPIGVILFGPNFRITSDLKENIQTAYKKLTDRGFSLFLFEYPNSPSPFSEIHGSNSPLTQYMSGRDARLDFTGVASEIFEAIKNQSKLRRFLLVGNSLGAGVVLWDYQKLIAINSEIKFLLIAPTQAYSPPASNIGPIKNLTLIAGEQDGFVRDPAFASWIKANKYTKTDTIPDGRKLQLGHPLIVTTIPHETLIQLMFIAYR